MQFRSKSQESVTLLITKAEWITLSEAVEDILFLKHSCKRMGIHITSPITVCVDNMGAVFMSNNVTTSSHTRHIDMHIKFVGEFVQGGVIVVRFV